MVPAQVDGTKCIKQICVNLSVFGHNCFFCLVVDGDLVYLGPKLRVVTALTKKIVHASVLTSRVKCSVFFLFSPFFGCFFISFFQVYRFFLVPTLPLLLLLLLLLRILLALFLVLLLGLSGRLALSGSAVAAQPIIRQQENQRSISI